MDAVACVITRYNETIDWIEYINPKVDIFYIYNKGLNQNLFKNKVSPEIEKKLKIIQSPNVGRIDHTIAYHIVKNWDTLEDTLIFLPGSILMCYAKGSYLSGINKRIDILRERYRGFFAPRFNKVSRNFNYSIDNYRAEGICNRNDNPFIKSEYPDFQTWKAAIIDDRPLRYVAMRGMFAVCRENIKHVSKSIYENILASVSVGDNIENGHFAERIWAHLFRQHSFDTLPPKDDYEIV